MYTGALCGLGVDKLGKPIYPDNDIEEEFEVSIQDSDINRINNIRDIINTMISNDSEILRSEKDKLKKFQKDNRHSLLKLLQTCTSDQKKFIDPVCYYGRYRWNEV